MMIIIYLVIYLVGVLLAKALLVRYDIDKDEHSDMWLSWLTVFLFILRDNR